MGELECLGCKLGDDVLLTECRSVDGGGRRRRGTDLDLNSCRRVKVVIPNEHRVKGDGGEEINLDGMIYYKKGT